MICKKQLCSGEGLKTLHLPSTPAHPPPRRLYAAPSGLPLATWQGPGCALSGAKKRKAAR